jgi:putative DNA primase/helicase
MTLNSFLQKLTNVKSSNNGYLCRCPAHDDKENSLSVTYKDEKILLHCHAGCSTMDILKSLNLEFRDLFNNTEVSKTISQSNGFKRKEKG